MKLYDAARCPFCARVRLALGEKAIPYETVEVDLGNRPAWLYELNPLGKVPVLDDGFPLPESAVVMEYLEELFPEPALLPADLDGRAKARLAVFRSNKHIYVQVIDDFAGHTLASASTMESDARGGATSTVAAAKDVGKRVGERVKAAGINTVVFDRGGFKYHGRIAAIADGAREAGLEF